LGDKTPDFNLKGVDGKSYGPQDFASSKILVVIFSCNHCPYVQAYEERMIQIQKEYAAKGVQFVLINSNEDKNYPDDSFENMVKRAEEKGYPFPYLRDDSQNVAKAYGATHTPHLFVFAKTGTVPDLPADRREAVESGLSPAWKLAPSTELRVPAGHPEGASVLAYTGKIDDNWQNSTQVKCHYLREAFDALLAGRKPAEPQTHAIGCTIKWRR
ncbi:MAG: thioredoxin family protein, partial [Elusimicrobia bacterium]|nr:thioredoxin family protein [Elusimicrobiota bacterium]